MSRRFGRNQKRKLTAELQKSRKERESALRAARHYDELIHHLRGCLGEASFFLPVQEVLFLAESIGYGNIRKQNYMTGAIQDVPVLRVRSEVDPENPLNAVHFLVNYGGDMMGYAISREVFRKMPREVLSQTIGREIADLLIDEMKRRSRS